MKWTHEVMVWGCLSLVRAVSSAYVTHKSIEIVGSDTEIIFDKGTAKEMRVTGERIREMEKTLAMVLDNFNRKPIGTQTNAATSCQEVLEHDWSATYGYYWIDEDGREGPDPPVLQRCIHGLNLYTPEDLAGEGWVAVKYVVDADAPMTERTSHAPNTNYYLRLDKLQLLMRHATDILFQESGSNVLAHMASPDKFRVVQQNVLNGISNSFFKGSHDTDPVAKEWVRGFPGHRPPYVQQTACEGYERDDRSWRRVFYSCGNKWVCI